MTRRAQLDGAIAKILGMDKLQVGDKFPEKPTHEWLRIVDDAYDAGYRAAIEDAAKIADARSAKAKESADIFDDHDQQKMVDRALANAAEAERVAAEIRKSGLPTC